MLIFAHRGQLLVITGSWNLGKVCQLPVGPLTWPGNIHSLMPPLSGKAAMLVLIKIRDACATALEPYYRKSLGLLATSRPRLHSTAGRHPKSFFLFLIAPFLMLNCMSGKGTLRQGSMFHINFTPSFYITTFYLLLYYGLTSLHDPFCSFTVGNSFSVAWK